MNERQLEIMRAVNSAIEHALACARTTAQAIEIAGENVRFLVQALTDEERDWALDALSAFYSRID